LNQPWVEDPQAEGNDEYRIFLADNKKTLKKTVRTVGPDEPSVNPSTKMPPLFAGQPADGGHLFDGDESCDCPAASLDLIGLAARQMTIEISAAARAV
jgi:hypothetical protein